MLSEIRRPALSTDARWNLKHPSRIGNGFWSTMQKPKFLWTILSAAIDKHAARHTLKYGRQ
jgi:hypothetical protein